MGLWLQWQCLGWPLPRLLSDDAHHPSHQQQHQQQQQQQACDRFCCTSEEAALFITIFPLVPSIHTALRSFLLIPISIVSSSSWPRLHSSLASNHPSNHPSIRSFVVVMDDSFFPLFSSLLCAFNRDSSRVAFSASLSVDRSVGRSVGRSQPAAPS